MKFLRNAALLTSVGAALSGCATTKHLAKPIEAYGKAFGAVDTALGDNGATYRRATRATLLHEAQAGFAGTSSSELTAFLGAASQPVPTDLSPIALFLICNPLKASAGAARAQAEVNGLGETLAETGKASPETVVGLVGALQAKYDVSLPEQSPQQAALADALGAQCEAVVFDSFGRSSGARVWSDQDLQELEAINGKAWLQGEASGARLNSSVAAVFGLLALIKPVVVGSLTIVDQARREEEIRKFFGDGDKVRKLQRAILTIDQAARVAELGSRLDAKSTFRARWVAYAQLQRPAPPAGIGADPALLKAYQDLLSASAELDVVARSRASDVVAKRTESDVNACRTPAPLPADAPPGDAPSQFSLDIKCPRTALGAALFKAVDRLQYAATLDWKKMKPEDRAAYYEGAFAVMTSLVDLSGKLAGFENDKENFRKLQDVLEDLSI